MSEIKKGRMDDILKELEAKGVDIKNAKVRVMTTDEIMNEFQIMTEKLKLIINMADTLLTFLSVATAIFRIAAIENMHMCDECDAVIGASVKVIEELNQGTHKGVVH